MLTGSISPIEVAEDWGDWFDLAPAFVLVYGTTKLQEMQDEAMFLYRPDVGDGPALSGRDRTYLADLEPLLDRYPEMRTGEGSGGGTQR